MDSQFKQQAERRFLVKMIGGKKSKATATLDAAIVAVPSDAAVGQALRLVRGAGQILLFAHSRNGHPPEIRLILLHPPGYTPWTLPPFAWMKKILSAVMRQILRSKKKSAASFFRASSTCANLLLIDFPWKKRPKPWPWRHILPKTLSRLW